MTGYPYSTPAAPPAAPAGPLTGESLPAIPAYACAECGASSPGAGVRRQSQAMVDSAAGPIRRGGRCRTCKRVARRAAMAFDATASAYLRQHGKGLYGAARVPVMDAAIAAGRLAQRQVLVDVAERAARTAARAVAA